ncbi:MAG: hypothetical protein CL923_09175 [Deltaproteobacteria bacterium]|nr:hypothetical protein [Deltaproteobacteria bacterium]
MANRHHRDDELERLALHLKVDRLHRKPRPLDAQRQIRPVSLNFHLLPGFQQAFGGSFFPRKLLEAPQQVTD